MLIRFNLIRNLFLVFAWGFLLVNCTPGGGVGPSQTQKTQEGEGVGTEQKIKEMGCEAEKNQENPLCQWVKTRQESSFENRDYVYNLKGQVTRESGYDPKSPGKAREKIQYFYEDTPEGLQKTIFRETDNEGDGVLEYDHRTVEKYNKEDKIYHSHLTGTNRPAPGIENKIDFDQSWNYETPYLVLSTLKRQESKNNGTQIDSDMTEKMEYLDLDRQNPKLWEFYENRTTTDQLGNVEYSYICIKRNYFYENGLVSKTVQETRESDQFHNCSDQIGYSMLLERDHKYDEEGRRIESTTHLVQTGLNETYQTHKYEYDSHGNLIKLLASGEDLPPGTVNFLYTWKRLYETLGLEEPH